MTTGELLDSSSTVSNVAAIIHLQNLGGGGSGFCVVSEMITLEDLGRTTIEEYDNNALIVESDTIVYLEEVIETALFEQVIDTLSESPSKVQDVITIIKEGETDVIY